MKFTLPAKADPTQSRRYGEMVGMEDVESKASDSSGVLWKVRCLEPGAFFMQQWNKRSTLYKRDGTPNVSDSFDAFADVRRQLDKLLNLPQGELDLETEEISDMLEGLKVNFTLKENEYDGKTYYEVKSIWLAPEDEGLEAEF